MSRYGLLIDYMYCSGCHTCRLACQQEHGFAPTTFGIEIKQVGPTLLSTDEDGNQKWQYDYIPVPTAYCDYCSDRVAKGKKPACVHHCQAACMDYGPLEELAAKMTGDKMMLITK